ncbi:MAG: hypothetical protein JJ970_05340 [Erythrobacter sp.]|nr:hypothetical protein [Erythrobacter sp.]MBO6529443.1 hypothetical protein [Erythrobacter sp.]
MRPIAGVMAAVVSCAVPVLVNAQDAQTAQSEEAEAFDAAAAWDEFEQLLRAKYAYIERDDIDVEAQFARSRALVPGLEDEDDLRRLLHRTALTFMDPHLIVGPFADDDYAIVMTAADVDMRFRNGKAMVIDVRRGSPAFEAGIRPGDELIEIDGESPDTAARLPFGGVLPDPSAAQLDYGLTLAANGRRGPPRNMVVAGQGEPARAVRLQSTRDYARSLSDRPLVALEFVGADSDVAVLRPLNSLGNNDTIAAFDRALAQAIETEPRAVILDMRETPSGGNTEVARSIIGHFVAEPKPYQMHRIPAFEREFTVPRQFVEYVMPREPRFAGRVYVLHGRWTGSMGEGIVIGMDAATDAVTIGSNMGDLLGGLWNFDLEHSNGRVDLGGETLLHIDGTPREDYVAQMPIEPASTAADGSDPAITAALRHLKGQ